RGPIRPATRAGFQPMGRPIQLPEMTVQSPHASANERMRRLPSALAKYKDFAKAAAALAKGQPAAFDGVWGSGRALLAASRAIKSDAPLVVVCATEREADDMAADLEFFQDGKPTTL